MEMEMEWNGRKWKWNGMDGMEWNGMDKHLVIAALKVLTYSRTIYLIDCVSPCTTGIGVHRAKMQIKISFAMSSINTIAVATGIIPTVAD
jgi:hypothetical protein